ncbi:hypothetical protein HLA86_12445 [Staphylococcus caprae]|uniref:hypothetical protein n=1 Tax=Staphylococcus caprae TaxID=29380 RepID=UPI001C82D334|nr:hypothetical protein [Staphylococcus caprae]MBX5320304.1 hypothetical protein [Staphylococcus caprae]
MKKSVALSLSSVLLATSLGTPFTQAKAATNTQSNTHPNNNQAKENRNINSDRIARESAKENGANLKRYDNQKQNRGKVTWTIKGLKAALQAKKHKLMVRLKLQLKSYLYQIQLRKNGLVL